MGAVFPVLASSALPQATIGSALSLCPHVSVMEKRLPKDCSATALSGSNSHAISSRWQEGHTNVFHFDNCPDEPEQSKPKQSNQPVRAAPSLVHHQRGRITGGAAAAWVHYPAATVSTQGRGRGHGQSSIRSQWEKKHLP